MDTCDHGHDGGDDDDGHNDDDDDDDGGDVDGENISCLDWETSAASPFINNSCLTCNSIAFMIWMVNAMCMKMNVIKITMIVFLRMMTMIILSLTGIFAIWLKV